MSLEDARAHARREFDSLPAYVRALEPARPAYRVDMSDALDSERERLRRAYESVS